MTLYNPEMVKDNCGFGLMAHLGGTASHKLVRTAIASLARMTHRGGIAADGRTGDGCGLLLQKPDVFFQAIAKEQGWTLGGRYGVGMVFLSRDPAKAKTSRAIIDEELARETLAIAGWREVPVEPTVLGSFARATMPGISSGGA